jgi:fatty-acyl-CoA synthase
VSDFTIARWIRDRARATPDRVAIDFQGRHVTYGELDARSEATARWFGALGLRPGDRVASLTGNSPEHVAALYACAKAGLVLLPLNWRLAAAELAYQLDDAEPSLLLVEPGMDAQAAEALAAASVRVPTAELGHVPGSDPAAATAPRPDGSDPLLLIYTSGTTGKPKGALLTHANCFWTNLSFDLATGISGDDVVLQVLPQFHVGGWNVHPLLAWWKGARVILERAFEPQRCLELIEGRRVTTMMGVPANYLFMSQAPAFDAVDLSSLRRAVVGGAPMPEALLETWRARGVDIVQGYGLTEAAPNVLCLPPEDAARKLGYAGKPYPFVEVGVRGGGDEGELIVRGPNVFPGYWRDEEATAAVFEEGWLLTGDVARRDADGYYRIQGRTKEMFISGGENVYPAEVESVLHEHPAIREAAVIGVADERWGEVGVAFVVGDCPEQEVVEWCRGRLARYKVPKSVRFLDELPRSAMGKVLKQELAAHVARVGA